MLPALTSVVPAATATSATRLQVWKVSVTYSQTTTWRAASTRTRADGCTEVRTSSGNETIVVRTMHPFLQPLASDRSHSRLVVGRGGRAPAVGTRRREGQSVVETKGDDTCVSFARGPSGGCGTKRYRTSFGIAPDRGAAFRLSPGLGTPWTGRCPVPPSIDRERISFGSLRAIRGTVLLSRLGEPTTGGLKLVLTYTGSSDVGPASDHVAARTRAHAVVTFRRL